MKAFKCGGGGLIDPEANFYALNSNYLTFAFEVGGHWSLCAIGGEGGVEVGTQRGSAVDSRNKT